MFGPLSVRNVLHAALVILAAGCITLTGSIAYSQTILRVRAATRIDIRTQDSTVIATLRDDRGNPIANQPITLVLRSRNGTTERFQYRTGPGGDVEHLLIRGQRYEVRVEYAGTAHLVGHVVAQQIVAGQQTIRVTLELPNDGRLNLDLDHTLTARVMQEASNTELELRDELGRALASGQTTEGTLTWQLVGTELGAEGAGYLRVSSPEDPRITSVEVPIIRYRPCQLTIESTPGRIQGTLSNSAGPLRRRAIGVSRLDGTLLATILTDQHGVWTWDDGDGVLAAGDQIRARFDSDGPGFPSAESEVLQLGETGGLSWLWFLLPLGLAAIAAWWSKRDRAPGMQRGSTLPGVSMGKIGQGKATMVEVSGIVQDTHQPDPIPGALLMHRRGDPNGQRAETDADGRFAVTLEPGSWTLVFQSEGCRPVTLDLTLPHRGEYSSMVVRVETWRAMSVRLLRTTAARLRGKPISHHVTVHQLRKAAQLENLGLEVEQIAYGGQQTDGGEMDILETYADDIAASPGPPERPEG